MRRITGAIALASAVVLTMSFVTPVPSASADAPTVTVMARTQRMSDASLSAAQAGWYEKGSRLTLDCHRRGQAVKGYFSPYLPNGGWDDLWYRVSDGYFVADVDIDTGSNAPVVGECPIPFDSTAPVAIVGDATVGSSVTAATGEWVPAAQFSFQWNVDGQPVGGANEQTWVLGAEAVGKRVTVAVTGNAPGRLASSLTSPEITVSPGAFVTGRPTISGQPVVGQKLSADPGSWAPNPESVSFQWKRDGTSIPGATASTYSLTAADTGRAVTVVVRVTSRGYTSASATSSSVSVLRVLTTAPVPRVTGTARVGSTLTAQPGSWEPTPVSLSYQWFRGGSAIGGATSSTYVVVREDAGAALTVEVSGAKKGYASATRRSDPTRVEKLLSPVGTPKVSGTPTVGRALTAAPGTWGPGTVSLTYQWLRGGQPISGATSNSYRVTDADAGRDLSVTILGSRSGYTPEKRTSASVRVGRPLSTATPVLRGTPRVGARLTADTGSWGPAPVSLALQWLRDGEPISQATSASYVLVAADAGAAISVQVTGTKTGYTSSSTVSRSVSVEKLLTTKLPRVAGTPTVGRTLTATVSAWGPAPVSLSYVWLRNGSPISGATSSTYRLTDADAGNRIAVRVTGKKSGYSSGSTTSSGLLVGRALTKTPTPTISGTPRVGATITASAGGWAPSPVTLKYQWSRNGVRIDGASRPTYTVTAADSSTSLTVTVTGSRTGYTEVSVTSRPVAVEAAALSGSVPVISGDARARATLSADPRTWEPSPVSLTYQWHVDGAAVGGANGSTFTVPTWAAGRTVTVSVTGSREGYASVTQTSAALAIGNDVGPALRRDETLNVNSALVSPNGQFRFTLQSDGNLVIYGPSGAIWGSRTDGKSPRDLVFQGDGNVVLYRTDGGAMWATATDGRPTTELVMQDDGNLVLYGDGGAFWASNTSQGGGGGGGGARFKLPFPAGTRYQITQGPAEHAAGYAPNYNRHAVDFGMGLGSKVVASAGGTVYFEGYDSTGAIQVRIDHGDNLCTQYVHLNRTVVNKGQRVEQGQWIGDSGQTGIGTGPHLHWNVVFCNSGVSREVPNTVENGTNYPRGSVAVSQNG